MGAIPLIIMKVALAAANESISFDCPSFLFNALLQADKKCRVVQLHLVRLQFARRTRRRLQAKRPVRPASVSTSHDVVMIVVSMACVSMLLLAFRIPEVKAWWSISLVAQGNRGSSDHESQLRFLMVCYSAPLMLTGITGIVYYMSTLLSRSQLRQLRPMMTPLFRNNVSLKRLLVSFRDPFS